MFVIETVYLTDLCVSWEVVLLVMNKRFVYMVIIHILVKNPDIQKTVYCTKCFSVCVDFC